MYPAPTRCPICGGTLHVEKLACPDCHTALEGKFSLQETTAIPPESWDQTLQQLAQLPPEYLDLILQQLPQFTPAQWDFLQRISRLKPEQWRFIEIFLRAEGRLNRVQEEINLSYPTVRNRLNEVVRDLGYEITEGEPEKPFPPSEKNPGNSSTLTVLERLSEGSLDIEDALRQLKSGS